jgi:hypothetical protein
MAFSPLAPEPAAASRSARSWQPDSRRAVGGLNSAQRFLGQAAWMAIFPGLSSFVVVLAFNRLGDGLRDALDPKGR